jgi:protocatechuate 3,4-dioxygenase beta subunit
LIAGAAVDASTGAPLDDVVVRLEPLGGTVDQRMSVITDERGRFVFRNVSPGTYTLRADRQDYMPGWSGAPWPRMELAVPDDSGPRTFEVGAGDRQVDRTIKLWKFASISGRVVDQAGQPMTGTTVRLLSTIVSGGRRTLTFDSWDCSGGCNFATTDDRGIYRFGRVAPGEYVVAVPSVITTVPASLQRLAAETRQVPEAFSRTSPGTVEWLGGGGVPVNAGFRAGDERFAIGYQGTRSLTIAALRDDGELWIFPTTFNPSATRLNDANRIRLAPGDRRTDANVSLVPARTSTVRGTLSGPSGPLADYVLTLIPMGQEELLTEPEAAATVSDADGSFVFAGVPPGDYWIRVFRRPPPVEPGRAPPSDRPRAESARTRVAVGAEGARDVSVTITTLPRVSGRIQFEAPNVAKVPGAPNVYIERADGRRLTGTGGSSARANERLEFVSEGHEQGHYLVQVPFEPAGWFLQSAMLGGRDVSLETFEVLSSDIDGLIVTFSDQPATILMGSVHDRLGAPVNAAAVLVFPADPRRWIATGRYARLLKQTFSGPSGTFTIKNLPPGDYRITALSNSEALMWRDPSVLAQLSKSAVGVTLRQGSTTGVRVDAIERSR